MRFFGIFFELFYYFLGILIENKNNKSFLFFVHDFWSIFSHTSIFLEYF